MRGTIASIFAISCFEIDCVQARAAARIGAPLVAVGAGVGLVSLSGEDHIDPPSYPFEHKGPFKQFDAAA